MSPQTGQLTVVECAEYDHIDVDPDLWVGDGHQTVFNSEIDNRDVLRASFQKGQLRLQATSYVGVIPINDQLVVRVKPRVPIGNLTRMVIDTGHSVMALSAFRDYSGRGTADDWAMRVYTDALIEYVDEVLDAGMIREYRDMTAEGHYPHGRINMTKTVQRHAARGIPNRASFSWFERTVDTPENRCIKAAMEIVHTHLKQQRDHPRKGDRTRLAKLSGLLMAFDAVPYDEHHLFLADPRVAGLNPLPDSRSYYRRVLDLSVLIVRGVGLALELDGDDVQLGSMLIDTNQLFESFVRVSLVRAAAARSWLASVLDGNTEGRVDFYDVPDELPHVRGSALDALATTDAGKAQPDIVVARPDGKALLIAEVKNTAHGQRSHTSDTLPERGEVEQAVTYALRYDLPFALLIHPWIRGKKGLVYVGRVRTIDVFDYRLDLSLDETMDASLEDMAEVVAYLARLEGSGAPISG